MDEGVLGMRVGQRRRVHIPSALGYGKRGSKAGGDHGGQDIPPSADLIFDICLTACAPTS
jgi:FKBP-type peptidyl-prolyl cis-trans isomerase